MGWSLRTCVVGLILLGSVGCLGKQLARDGVAIHEAMIEIYTDQAMVNLIHARCNEPFVQLTFSKVSVNDKDVYKGNAEVDQTTSTARDLFVAAATRTLTNLYI